MPKNPVVEPNKRQSKKKQGTAINKRQKPDLLVVDKFPLLKQPTFVQKDRFTGVNMPVFI
jgi:hypothetical protein